MFRRHLQPHTGVYEHIYFVVWIVVFLSLDSVVFFGSVICPRHLFVFFCIFLSFFIDSLMFWWFCNVFVKFQLFSVIFSNCPLVFFTFHWFSLIFLIFQFVFFDHFQFLIRCLYFFIGFLTFFHGFLSFISWIVQLFSWFFIGLPQNVQWICWCHARKSKKF